MFQMFMEKAQNVMFKDGKILHQKYDDSSQIHKYDAISMNTE